MARYWKSPSGSPSIEKTVFNEAGDWVLNQDNIRKDIPIAFAASGAASGDGGTIQLWGRLAGKKTNIGSATAVSFASPVVWPNVIYLDGEIGFTLSSITGNGIIVETAP